jgi:hypothetical protein
VVELFTVVNARSPLAGVRLPRGSPSPSHSSVSASSSSTPPPPNPSAALPSPGPCHPPASSLYGSPLPRSPHRPPFPALRRPPLPFPAAIAPCSSPP